MAISDIHWRALTMLDMPALADIAAQVHPDYFEDLAVLAEKLTLYPDGARLLEIAGEPAGYLLSHPYPYLSVPPLNRLIGKIPAPADCLYLHDLALLPKARGRGAAGWAVEDLARHAQRQGFSAMALVSVGNSAAFWGRFGFSPVDRPELAAKLASYSETARYMVRPLDRSLPGS
ncbi:N-acetyltransferase [Devosia pacifica]|uniref:N-acetyltransferase n=1 Tax=Devosia pacifica TaxID=1335967 RepID=A0A918VR44_9HYPH|nr:GNAT family N-acetyltransferase [Devosia pacifica]GHA21079.1 N-acetyltransferase [Devosia pacifica]